ncbi:MAG TPA: hypothetical protein VMT87_10765 [Vicinamibacteria bacterium]|nr:hypothetical protein [Vicinamibacteria bacterium]
MAAESRKACCLVSEILEEAGLDRQKARALRRQILQGIVLFCQWQLERIDRADAPRSPRRKRAERVPVE